MKQEEAAAAVKQAVTESNQHFLLSYLDGNGFPHSSYMGFAHLNKNFSVVMIVSGSSRKAEVIKEQPWIELVFNSTDYAYVAKFFGRAVLSNSVPTVQKLLAAYPQLKNYFPADGEGAVLIQLQTQLIELEYLPPGEKWHQHKSYMVQNKDLEEVENPVLQGASVGPQEKSGEEFDSIRRQITKNHGEILMNIIHQDYDALLNYVSDAFSGMMGEDREGYKQRTMTRYKDVELANAEINWGLRDFEQKRDGTVVCQYFLDITPQGGEQVSLKQKETWVLDGEEWMLLAIEE